MIINSFSVFELLCGILISFIGEITKELIRLSMTNSRVMQEITKAKMILLYWFDLEGFR